ncbi:MAG: GreA/GreB family elongation factor [Bdellovibrionota bacterium]
MDKKKLVEAILGKLESERLILIEAARATYDAATNEESKPENEYDTRGLEASYLAGAQAKRVADIEEVIALCKSLEVKSYTNNSPIGASALVQVDYNAKKSYVFLMPKGGGTLVTFDSKTIQVIAPNSPLGTSLLGLKTGDVAMVETEADVKEYEILSVE